MDNVENNYADCNLEVIKNLIDLFKNKSSDLLNILGFCQVPYCMYALTLSPDEDILILEAIKYYVPYTHEIIKKSLIIKIQLRDPCLLSTNIVNNHDAASNITTIVMQFITIDLISTNDINFLNENKNDDRAINTIEESVSLTKNSLDDTINTLSNLKKELNDFKNQAPDICEDKKNGILEYLQGAEEIVTENAHTATQFIRTTINLVAKCDNITNQDLAKILKDIAQKLISINVIFTFSYWERDNILNINTINTNDSISYSIRSIAFNLDKIRNNYDKKNQISITFDDERVNYSFIDFQNKEYTLTKHQTESYLNKVMKIISIQETEENLSNSDRI